MFNFHFKDMIPNPCESNKGFTSKLSALDSFIKKPTTIDDLFDIVTEEFEYTYNGLSKSTTAFEYLNYLVAFDSVLETSGITDLEFFVNGRSASRTATKIVKPREEDGQPHPVFRTTVAFTQVVSFAEDGRIESLHQIEDTSQFALLGFNL